MHEQDPARKFCAKINSPFLNWRCGEHGVLPLSGQPCCRGSLSTPWRHLSCPGLILACIVRFFLDQKVGVSCSLLPMSLFRALTHGPSNPSTDSKDHTPLGPCCDVLLPCYPDELGSLHRLALSTGEVIVCCVEHAMWNSQRTDHNRGTGGAGGRGHFHLRVAIMIQGNSVPNI